MKLFLSRESSAKCITDKISLQTDYLQELHEDVDYKGNVNAKSLIFEWLSNSRKDVLTNRDHTHVSLITGKESCKLDRPFMDYKEDPLLHLLKEP